MIVRKSLAGLAVALLASSAVACSGKDGGGSGAWKPPGKGQAAQLLDFSDGGRDAGTRTVAFYGFSGLPNGMTTGADGSVYVAGQKVVRLKPDRTVSTAPGAAGTLSGIVALPDGSLVYGAGGQVRKADPAGKVTVLAGAGGPGSAAGGTTAPETAQTAQTAKAAGFRFTATPVLFGVTPNGAVLLADRNVLWSLKDGTLTRFYRFPAKAPDGLPLQVRPGAAADASGMVYVSSAEDQGTPVPGRLGDVLFISTRGTGKPLLPKSIAGLPGDPADFKVTWLAGDGADGVFAQIHDPSGGNGAVVHLHSGKADLVAHEKSGIKSGTTCRMAHPVDALRLPCALPAGMTYRSGSLVLGGTEDYVLQIRPA